MKIINKRSFLSLLFLVMIIILLSQREKIMIKFYISQFRNCNLEKEKRFKALEKLDELGLTKKAEKVAPYFLDIILKKNGDEFTRYWAMAELTRYPGVVKKYVNEIIEITLNEPNREVRAWGVVVIKKVVQKTGFENEKIVNFFKQMLKDKSRDARECAIWGIMYLKNINLEQKISLILEMLRDKDRCVRKTANECLNLLTGKEFGPDYEKWLRWWKTERKKDEFNRINRKRKIKN